MHWWGSRKHRTLPWLGYEHDIDAHDTHVIQNKQVSICNNFFFPKSEWAKKKLRL